MAIRRVKKSPKSSLILQELIEMKQSLVALVKILSNVIVTKEKKNIAIQTNQITLNATEPQLIIVENTDRNSVIISNIDNAISVYLGDRNVTAQNGHVLEANTNITFDHNTGSIWALAASGTPTISIVSE